MDWSKPWESVDLNDAVKGIDAELNKSTDFLFSQLATAGLYVNLELTELLGIEIKELEGIRDTFDQLSKVVRGDYRRDAEDIKKQQDEYDKEKDIVSSMSADLVGIVLLYDEIYQIAGANEIDRYIDSNITPLELKLQKQIAEFNESYGEIIKLQGTFLGKIFLSPFLILGGIVYDFGNMLEGDMVSTIRIVSLIISIVLIVITWGSDVSSWVLIIEMVVFYISLDSTFGGGGIMTVTMQMLDFFFNDVFHTDTYINETNRFKEDSEYYEETKGYISMSMAIMAIVINIDFNAMYKSFTQEAGEEATKEVAKESSKESAGQLATGLKSVQQATSFYQGYVAGEKLKSDLKERIDMLNKAAERADKERRAKILADTESYTTPHQERVSNYEANFDAGAYEYKDPMYLVPLAQVANNNAINDTFQDMFSDNNLAGSDNYFKNMLYS